LLIALCAGACIGTLVNWAEPTADAAETTGPQTLLHVAFSPKRLGAATAISFRIAIDPPARQPPPPPLSLVDFSYPSGLGFATSGLGLAACSPTRLESEGAAACPANSKVGTGEATAEVRFGPETVEEHIVLELFAGPSSDGYLHLLVLATGKEPVQARIVMTGVVLPGHLRIDVPPVPALPGGPGVSLSAMSATLGGRLIYYEHTGNRSIAYRPHGIGLPDRCPRAGWRLAAALRFIDGLSSTAHTSISCPSPRAR
jgi:hypothetical protein